MATYCNWSDFCHIYHSNNNKLIVTCCACTSLGGHSNLFQSDKYLECPYCDNFDKPEICRDCEMSFNYIHFMGYDHG